MVFQYVKNIGRRLKIQTIDDQELTIKLLSSNDTGVSGEDKSGKEINLAFDQIQKAKVIIEF